MDAQRRRFLAVCSAFGVSGTLMPGVLWSLAQNAPNVPDPKKITRQMIDQAADVAGISIDDQYKEMMLDDLNAQAKSYEAVRALKVPNNVPPALRFDPELPGMKFEPWSPAQVRLTGPAVAALPKDPLDLVFSSVAQQAEWLRTKKISSVTLTETYIERINTVNPILHFMITPTFDRARMQAKEADREIAAGKYRGPLHGVTWGAKDLLAVKGYPTTWGAHGFEEQKFGEDATVVKRLDEAGAVLLGKTSLGALAMGDYWFGETQKGERTRNPWRIEQGSSGSSAGSASGTAGGCFAFAIGSETLGSISSPCTRVGASGLRPTFGRVPRTGAMALSWSMDKLGPICRIAEDTALVLSVIHGADNQDLTARSYAFHWPPRDLKTIRVGYLHKDFEEPPKFDSATDSTTKPEDRERITAAWHMQKQFNDAALETLSTSVGLELMPVQLPNLPASDMLTLLGVESAAAFDELTRSGRDKLLNAQDKDDWPNQFRVARFVPGVEYVNANRARTLLMQGMAERFKKVDVIVAPTDSDQLVVTNLTGHPAAIVPCGFRPANAPLPTKPTRAGGPGTPVSITFIGNLYGESDLLAVAMAYQRATDFHLKRPKL
jgi:Asp-tRNA(Asn)/Glu-tRNA(Gln) amidotransferase A subunit family amidase